MPLALRNSVWIVCCVLAASLGSTAGAASQPADPAPAFTQRLADLINRYRADKGLPPLVVEDSLVSLAAEHSGHMAEQRQMSHEGFRARAQSTYSRICVENVATNFRTPEAVLQGWQLSPTHERNLVEPKVMRMGIAARTRYVTFFACL